MLVSFRALLFGEVYYSIDADTNELLAAKVLGMEGKLGCIKVGAFADLLLLESNPLDDVRILNRPKEYLKAVIKDGRCVHSLVDGLRVEIPLE